MVWLIYGRSRKSRQAFFASRFSTTITYTALPLHLLFCVPLGIGQIFVRRLPAPMTWKTDKLFCSNAAVSTFLDIVPFIGI